MYSNCLPCLYQSKHGSVCFRSNCPLFREHQLHEPNNVAYQHKSSSNNIKSFDLNKLLWMVANQLLRAIAFIHRLKIIHRNITLGNVLFDAMFNQLKLIDFGDAIDMKNEIEMEFEV